MKTKKSEFRFRQSNLYLLFLLAAVGAFFVTKHFDSPSKNDSPEPSSILEIKNNRQNSPIDSASKVSKKISKFIDTEAEKIGALKNQRILIFPDRNSLEAFLMRKGNRLLVLDQIDALNALHMGFFDLNDLLSKLDGSEKQDFVYSVSIPEFKKEAQTDAVPLNDELLKWLGVTEDHSLWGTGVKIAILDTGIADHLAFKNLIERVNLVPLPADMNDLNGHGTAVASLIFSSNSSIPGIAPGATGLSIRIANDQGQSNSTLIAKGIIEAVTRGADLINISMGSQGTSQVVTEALLFAKKAGVMVIAAAGNSGQEGVMSPASDPSVIAVGAIDAAHQSLNFSTTGEEIDIAAPGYGVNSAYTGNRAGKFNGTSFSAPIITGLIAATKSPGRSAPIRSSKDAWQEIQSNLVDIGDQGKDISTGAGSPDIWRMKNQNQSGIYDASITSITAKRTQNGQQGQILVQNLGTETLINSTLTISNNGHTTTVNIPTLPRGKTQLISIPLDTKTPNKISGSIHSSKQDTRPSNNKRSVSISP